MRPASAGACSWCRPATRASFSMSSRPTPPLIVTASDAEHSSFGCEEDRDLTWFGEAFLQGRAARQHQPRRTPSRRRASLIAQRENAEHQTHSNPQLYVGAGHEARNWPTSRRGATAQAADHSVGHRAAVSTIALPCAAIRMQGRPRPGAGQPFTVVILAAGEGKRMKSALPKVLQPLAGRPLLAARHRHRHAGSRPPRSTSSTATAVTRVREALAHEPVAWVLQARASRAPATPCCRRCRTSPTSTPVLVLYGDVPLIRAQTLDGAAGARRTRHVALLTVRLDDPHGLRAHRARAARPVRRIVEQKDATRRAAEAPRVQHRRARRARRALLQALARRVSSLTTRRASTT